MTREDVVDREIETVCGKQKKTTGAQGRYEQRRWEKERVMMMF
jgi:hypothetical protein